MYVLLRGEATVYHHEYGTPGETSSDAVVGRASTKPGGAGDRFRQQLGSSVVTLNGQPNFTDSWPVRACVV